MEALSFREVMRTLALSQTHYHREQRRAIEMVAAYLWDTLPSPGLPQSGPSVESAGRSSVSLVTDRQPLRVEISARRDDRVCLASLLAEIVQLLDQVATQHMVQLIVTSVSDDMVLTDRTTLRNAVISSVGFLLQGARLGEIVLSAHRYDAVAQIDIRYHGSLSWRQVEDLYTEQLRSSQELMQAIGGTLRGGEGDCGVFVSLSFPAGRQTLLVIDDNPDLVQLITRYLVDQEYAVFSAGSVEEGIVTAQNVLPDIILLDIMMPHRDGWDALQLLRHHPATAEIPIIVCTVLADAHLAKALGATAFIRKPLTRPALLQVLEQSLSVRRPPPVGEGPGAPEHRVSSG